MSEETTKETPKEEKKKFKIHECNRTPDFFIYFQNNCSFRTFATEEDMRTFLVEFFKDMGDVFGEWESYKNKSTKELLLEYDKQFLKFVEIIKKKIDNKEKIEFEEKYHNFDKYGRIITNFSVVSVPIEAKKGVKVVVSKSLFYHYCELMSICTKMGILEMSAVFSTASYSDGSLSINFDDSIPESDRKTDFVKPFFILGIDGISKGINLFFVEAKKPEEKKEEVQAEDHSKAPENTPQTNA